MKRVKWISAEARGNLQVISRFQDHLCTKIFRKEFRFTAHKKQSRQFFSAASEQKRHDWGKSILVKMQRTVDHVFHLVRPTEGTLQGMQGICLKVVVPISFTSYESTGVILWASVASDGTSLVFTEEGVKITMLAEKVVRRSCRSVTSSLELMVKANGSHFEIWLL